MKKELSQKISELLKQFAPLKDRTYTVHKSIEGEVLNNFHEWANGNAQTGTFW